MQNLFSKEEWSQMGKVLFFLAVVFVLYFGMSFFNEMKTFGLLGTQPKEATTIDVSGEGELYAIPDIATINYSVEAKGKTVAVAQSLVKDRINQTISFLEKTSIDKKDIQTTNYSSYPEYSNPCVESYGKPCVAKEPVILDYVVNESVSVKVRNTDNSGVVVDGLGGIGVSGISGPNYSVDNTDTIKAQARQKAIDDAKQKAQVLANQLGVHLGKIIRFSENPNSPVPMMYAAKAGIAGGSVASDSTSMPTGQNRFVSDVVISYEIY